MYFPGYDNYFIHIPKTGGTSIELKLFDELYNIQLPEQQVFGKLGRALGSKFHYGIVVPGVRYETQHLTAWDCTRFHVEDFLTSTYKFAIVRNPWERFVSEVRWKQQRLHARDWTYHTQIANTKRELEKDTPIRRPHDAPMWKFVYDPNMNLLVDEVFKLEEWDKIEKRLSEVFGRKLEFGHLNKSNRKSVDEELDSNLKERIYPCIKDDLEIFGYE